LGRKYIEEGAQKQNISEEIFKKKIGVQRQLRFDESLKKTIINEASRIYKNLKVEE